MLGRDSGRVRKTYIHIYNLSSIYWDTFQDLAVFLQLLPRSSTGEHMNPYTSLWTGVTPRDGPQAFHLVLLDNERTSILADDVGRQTLHCIRCSVYLNICPVYSRTGGHAYGSVYPGPISAILTLQMIGVEHAKTLPYASTLCGACYEVCLVKINIPEVLLHLRGQVIRQASPLDPKALAMRGLARIFAHPKRYEHVQQVTRCGKNLFMHEGMINSFPGLLDCWTTARDLMPIPKQSFRDWWRERQREDQT